MKYATTLKADQDIIDLYAYGARAFGVMQAEAYAEGLFATFALLAENPNMARERHELTPPTRLHPFCAHMIAYLAREDDILIVRVLHGRRGWEALLS